MTLPTSPGRAEAVSAPLRVLALGDSITHGYVTRTDNQGGGYRKVLWDMAQQAGADIDFVGSRQDGPASLPDRDHEGHGGRTMDWLLPRADGIVRAADPDVVLLMIGSNDTRSDGVSTMLWEMSRLVDAVAAAAPGARILVASLPPIHPGAQPQDRIDRAAAFDKALPGLLAKKAAEGRDVGFVSMEHLALADLTGAVDDNGMHPNAAGYRKIGEAWYGAMAEDGLVPPVGAAVTSPRTVRGTDADDTMLGRAGADSLAAGAGNDLVSGLGGDDRLDGGSGDDLLYGGAGDDTLLPGRGADLVEGGTGMDTVVLDRPQASLRVVVQADGVVVVTDGSADPLGTKVLAGVERLAFADGVQDIPAPAAPDTDPLVDDGFYLLRDPALAGQADPDAQYAASGWREGRDPNAFFSTAGYLSSQGDVRAAGVDPLAHYRESGWKEGRDPSAAFDTTLYLLRNPQARESGLDPLTHYLTVGRAQGDEAAPALGRGIGDGGFDREFYLLSNPDVGAAGVDPLEHFLQSGWREGRDPNAWFDTSGYLAAYGDVAAAGVNPLEHYHQLGWREGRDPSARFDTSRYRDAYADVAEAQVNPLQHFLQHGAYELRSGFGDGLFG